MCCWKQCMYINITIDAFISHVTAKTNKKVFPMSLSLVFYTTLIINGILVRYTFSAVPHTAFKLHLINTLWTALWRRSRDMNQSGTIHLSRNQNLLSEKRAVFLKNPDQMKRPHRESLAVTRGEPLIKPMRRISFHWILTVKTKTRKLKSH